MDILPAVQRAFHAGLPFERAELRHDVQTAGRNPESLRAVARYLPRADVPSWSTLVGLSGVLDCGRLAAIARARSDGDGCRGVETQFG